ncbi:hypothetical protein MGSAQ_001720 [marine sediment metagenome]|uniref:Uncharacterized protein n=1 Tax=marine sediment metagenome TaxID=412755 RepID=A0A1B6NTI5_9ZZZZ
MAGTKRRYKRVASRRLNMWLSLYRHSIVHALLAMRYMVDSKSLERTIRCE